MCQSISIRMLRLVQLNLKGIDLFSITPDSPVEEFSLFPFITTELCFASVQCHVLHRRARLGQVFEIIFNLQQFEMFSNIFVQPWGLDKRSTWHGLLKECE